MLPELMKKELQRILFLGAHPLRSNSHTNGRILNNLFKDVERYRFESLLYSECLPVHLSALFETEDCNRIGIIVITRGDCSVDPFLALWVSLDKKRYGDIPMKPILWETVVYSDLTAHRIYEHYTFTKCEHSLFSSGWFTMPGHEEEKKPFEMCIIA